MSSAVHGVASSSLLSCEPMHGLHACRWVAEEICAVRYRARGRKVGLVADLGDEAGEEDAEEAVEGAVELARVEEADEGGFVAESAVEEEELAEAVAAEEGGEGDEGDGARAEEEIWRSLWKEREEGEEEVERREREVAAGRTRPKATKTAKETDLPAVEESSMALADAEVAEYRRRR